MVYVFSVFAIALLTLGLVGFAYLRRQTGPASPHPPMIAQTAAPAKWKHPALRWLPALILALVPLVGLLLLANFDKLTASEAAPRFRPDGIQPPAGPLAYVDAIIGLVFRDNNANGLLDAAEPGVDAPITVTAYDNSGAQVAQTTTAVDGSYSLNIPANTQVRVEFTNLPSYLRPGPAGSDSATTVAFVNVGASGSTILNLGVSNPFHYCQNNPQVALSCFTRADNMLTTGQPAIVSHAYLANGTGVPETIHAYANQVGTIYGLAYHASSGVLFGGTYIRRGAGVGPTNSTGTIYKLTGAGAPSTFIDLNATGVISTGANPHPNGVGSYNWITDTPTYTAAGKIGLGDVELAEDGSALYAVNLYQKELVILPLTYDGTGQPVAPAPASILTRPVPIDATCNGDGVTAPAAADWRPFALKYHDNRLYVGVVCSAQTMLQNLSPTPTTIAGLAAVRAAMRAYVYEFDPAGNTFNPTPILSFPLNYAREQVNDGFPTAPTNDGEWLPWNDIWRPAFAPTRGGLFANPQPILSDIELDSYGFMSLGFRDRFGDQAYDIADPGPQNQALVNTRQGGDILLACLDGSGNWQIESGSSCTNGLTGETRTAGPPPSADAGASAPEFYHNDQFLSNGNPASPLYHDETALGALALMQGSGEIMATKYDTFAAFEAGTIVFNNANGNRQRAVQVYPPNTAFGKSGGLGDLELMCMAAPLEIGNYVWLDSNRNGVQDPGETPMAGIEVVLYLNGTAVATATTDSNGQYYFIGASNPVAATAGSNYGIAPVLLPNTNYEIQIDLSQPALTNYAPTTLDYNGNVGNSNMHDSDGDPTINAGSVTAPLTTGNPGENDHTYDFGFYPIAGLGDYVWLDLDQDGVQDVGEPPVSGVTVNLYQPGPDGIPGTPDDIFVATTTTDGVGFYNFTNLPPGDYYVEMIPPPGYGVTTPNAGSDDAADSDINPVTGQTPVVTLGPGEYNPTLDGGLYLLQPDLVIDKIVSIARLAPNQVPILTYTLRITNTGNAAFTTVNVTDTLDAGLTYLPGSATPPPTSVSGQTLVWLDLTGGAPLPPGGVLQIVLEASVTTATGSYVNTATVEGSSTSVTGGPPPYDSDTDQVTVQVEDPTVEVVKQVVPPGVVNGLITFTIQITNTGPSPLDVLPMIDTFSGPIEYVGGTPPADLVDNPNGIIGWNDLTQFFGNIAPGQVILVETVFRVTSTDGEISVINTAEVANVRDTLNNPANNDQDTVTLINTPTAVDLLYFQAEPAGTAVRLKWATAVEIDNYGFRLKRGLTNQPADAVDLGFIPGQGYGSQSGSSYTYLDGTVQAGQTYYYWLIDIDLNGLETGHGPVSITATTGRPDGQPLYLPLINR